MSIITSNITKLFGKQKALDNVSLTIKKGELVGFLGPNGAGKSTLMKIINGYIPADEGEVFIHEQKIDHKNLEIRKSIGYLPEHNPLYTDLYIKEFLEITAGFYQLKNKKQRVAEMVDLVGLGDEQHKKIKALSKGYRQRVGLAQALIHNPTVLILDEPTTGLDPNQLEEIRNLIREISKDKTVILSSHIMQEVEAVCNRVIIINKGKIVADGGIDAIKSGSISGNQVVKVEFLEKCERKKLQEMDAISKVVETEKGFILTAISSSDIRPQIFNFAVANQLTIISLHEKQQNLENVFHQVTQGR